MESVGLQRNKKDKLEQGGKTRVEKVNSKGAWRSPCLWPLEIHLPALKKEAEVSMAF